MQETVMQLVDFFFFFFYCVNLFGTLSKTSQTLLDLSDRELNPNLRSISAASQDKNRLTCTSPPPPPPPQPPGPSASGRKSFSQTRLPSPCQRCRWRHQQPFIRENSVLQAVTSLNLLSLFVVKNHSFYFHF